MQRIWQRACQRRDVVADDATVETRPKGGRVGATRVAGRMHNSTERSRQGLCSVYGAYVYAVGILTTA
jgi:hypothetical protein